MVIIVYSAESGESITANLGRPEYSYYFVSKAFRTVLRKLAYVIETSDPENEVDAIYEKCRSMGEPCVFLSFSPPHKTVTGLKCPTIPVFAWEFATIPNEPFAGDVRNDWQGVLCRHGCAITHSSFAVRAVHEALGSEFPVWSVPAPVWDDYAALARVAPRTAQLGGFDLTFQGTVIDFKGCDAPAVPEADRKDYIEQRSLPNDDGLVTVHLNGVVYTALFSAIDGRKNWQDLISGFIWAFRNSEDATLVLKVIYRDLDRARGMITNDIFKLVPFKCRVVILRGYLDEAQYSNLIQHSTYVVNTSHGEGQCLPLMEYMSAGTPAISPAHTAMEEYITAENSFVVRSSVERAFWPQDLREAFRTTRYRINWESLCEAYSESYRVAKCDPARYARMSRSAVESLQGYCSRALAEERLKIVFRERGTANEKRDSAHRKTWRIVVGATLKMWSIVVFLKVQSVRAGTRNKLLRAYASAKNILNGRKELG